MKSLLLISCLALTVTAADPAGDGSRRAERMRMVKQQIESRGITDPRVLRAMGSVPRHRLVPQRYRGQAYSDHPLPIGAGQTISQPYVVALMTEALDLDPDDRVLEIGTGSGYQAAVLAEIVSEVYSIEIRETLAREAARNLRELGYENIQVNNADGYYGWPEAAPFDAVIITAAANHIPPPLLKQLREGGRLILPLGPTLRYQMLTLLRKSGSGEVKMKQMGSVRFVPMVGRMKD